MEKVELTQGDSGFAQGLFEGKTYVTNMPNLVLEQSAKKRSTPAVKKRPAACIRPAAAEPSEDPEPLEIPLEPEQMYGLVWYKSKHAWGIRMKKPPFTQVQSIQKIDGRLGG